MRINLLPPELRERQRSRRQTFGVIAVGVVILALIGAFFVLQRMRLAEVQQDLEDQRAANAQIQQEIAELQDFDALRQELEASRTLVAQLMQNEVAWSGVLRDISLVIPGEAWLTTMTGNLTTAPAGEEVPEPTAPAAAGLVGQVTFTGFAFDHRTAALWLSRLEDVRGFVNPWLTNSQKTEIGPRQVVEFTSSVDLSEAAVVGRRLP